MFPGLVRLLLHAVLVSCALHACRALFYVPGDTYPGYMQFAPSDEEEGIITDMIEDEIEPVFNKRAGSAIFDDVNKRATIDQLLQKLIAIFGDHEIPYSGRSSHVRFGAGGKKR